MFILSPQCLCPSFSSIFFVYSCGGAVCCRSVHEPLCGSLRRPAASEAFPLPPGGRPRHMGAAGRPGCGAFSFFVSSLSPIPVFLHSTMWRGGGRPLTTSSGNPTESTLKISIIIFVLFVLVCKCHRCQTPPSISKKSAQVSGCFVDEAGMMDEGSG